MKAVFDTNILIDHLSGVPEAAASWSAYTDRIISRITWLEVLSGADTPQEDQDARAFMTGFRIIELDDLLSERVLTVRKAHPKKIKLPDAIIYATAFGTFQLSLVRMHDDLMQQCLLKKDKKAASFVTIGEPDIRLHVAEAAKASGKSSKAKADETLASSATVEIAGLDIYDPIKDEVKSRDLHDIAYWMLDDDYDGSNFVVRQVFFCGGDKDEFADWKKGLSKLAEEKTKKKVEQTLKIEIDAEAFSRLYGHTSHPFPVKKGQKVAVRVVSQFGEETTKVLEVK